MTISQAFSLFRKQYVAYRGLSKETDRTYYESVGGLIKFTGDIFIESLTPEHVMNWRFSLDNKETTIRMKLYRVRTFLEWTNSKGITVFDIESIVMPKLSMTRLPKYISPDDVREMIEYTEEIRHKAIIATLFSTGCRASEIATAKLSDYDGRSLRVVGKGNKERITYIDPSTQVLIDEYLSTRTDKLDSLFVSFRKRPLKRGSILTIVKNASIRAGLMPISTHQMRHSFAIDLVKNGAPMPAVQQLLGHALITTTQVYTLFSEEDNREAYEKAHTGA